MTEAEWMKGEKAVLMLPGLKRDLNERKLRLFACACCRALQGNIMPEKIHEVIDVAERYADGLLRGDERKTAWRWAENGATEAGELTWEVGGGWGEDLRVHTFATRMAAVALTPPGETAKALHAALLWEWPHPVSCATLARDVFGNPFRPLAARPFPGHVVELARECYSAFPEVSNRFLILADALADLEEDGAAGHCREGGHVKGCHVIDWVLARK